jgi:hypothetical protein
MYCKLTDMPGKKKEDPMVLISLCLVSSNLKVDRHCLREWKEKKQKILQMKKGAKRWQGQSYRKEPKMEFQLYKEFVKTQGEEKIISSQWFFVYAKAIYRLLYPLCISQDEVTGCFEYNLFSFSKSWFNGFKKRYQVSMQCKTKQAQKPPADFYEKIEAWLQFNRQNTITNPDSDCGISHSPAVPLVG